ncbi:hypothetical protein FITA111629_04220 [Filibacter tadaridae]|uniref:Uncharacterized protein n=1 Tax=Filibacter tadaridae TaxID=2483811 RepID=A0A3P5XNX2_9BACL|nr:hypothetical protein FILTAD_02786 [Filibacter tadaridae]
MAEIHPTEANDEKHHRGSMLNKILSVGVDGAGRYPETKWALMLYASIWVEPRKLTKALVPCIGKGWGSFSIFKKEL